LSLTIDGRLARLTLERGVKAALTARDGPFGDYGARPRKP